jgi:hypothetical protein
MQARLRPAANELPGTKRERVFTVMSPITYELAIGVARIGVSGSMTGHSNLPKGARLVSCESRDAGAAEHSDLDPVPDTRPIRKL